LPVDFAQLLPVIDKSGYPILQLEGGFIAHKRAPVKRKDRVPGFKWQFICLDHDKESIRELAKLALAFEIAWRPMLMNLTIRGK
jgi:hypothetical protein